MAAVELGAEQLRTLLDGLESGVALLDEEGIVRYANRALATICGRDAASLGGRPVHEALPALHGEIDWKHAAHHAIRRGRTVRLARFALPEGGRVLDCALAPIRLGRDDVALLTVADVSEAVRLEERLLRQARTQAIANLGDSVAVSGMVRERGCQTEIEMFPVCGRVVRTGRTVDVVFIPVSANGFQPDINERWAMADWLFRVYPVSRIGVWETSDGVSNNYNFPDTSGSGCGDGWGGLLDDLWWFNFWREDGVSWLRYYGMVDPRSLMGSRYSGCGYRPGDESAGIVSPGNRNGPETAAQEVGHNHGRRHAPSGPAANTDPGYPNPSGLLDEWGVDVGRMQLYPPTSSFDYMGYGGSEGNSWTSAYTYRAMASAIQSVAYLPGGGVLARPARLQEATAEFFVGGGFISPTAVEVRQGFYRATLPVTASDGLFSGPYTVEMLDAAGQTLYARGFSLPELSNSEPEAGGGFQLFLPWKDGTTTVAFQYNGAEIGRVTRSSSAPDVKVTSPVGGEHWGANEEQTVSWAAADPDGDPLMYSVQYSPDKGQTWLTLGANLTDTGIKVNTAHVAGGQAALVRVFATDGFNTTSATSPGTFTVDGHAPEVYIGSPDDGLTLTQGDPLVLHAYGTDVEDGPLPEGSFEWASSADGALGGGDLIVTDSLSVGAHDITVTGQDAQGNTATYSVKLTVQPVPTQPAGPDSGTIEGPSRSQLLIWIGVAITVVGLVVIGAAVVLSRRRRA